MRLRYLLALGIIALFLVGCTQEFSKKASVQGYTIRTEKNSYAIGEQIKFVGEFETDIYHDGWVGKPIRPIIYKKEDSSWVKIKVEGQGSKTGCDELEEIKQMREELNPGSSNFCSTYIKTDVTSPICLKFNPKSIWVWNQEVVKEEKIDCEGPPEVFCRKGMEGAEPGLYKAEFTYTTGCEKEGEMPKQGESVKIETNEFTITRV